MVLQLDMITAALIHMLLNMMTAMFIELI